MSRNSNDSTEGIVGKVGTLSDIDDGMSKKSKSDPEKTGNEAKLGWARRTNCWPLLGRWGISNSTLKILAILLMFVDHIGAGLLKRYCNMLMSTQASPDWMEQYDHFYDLYTMCRAVGRLSFPLFVFLLVEGFKNTEDIWKYLKRMTIFALISEVPFDLCFYGKVIDLSKQNVFFTLLTGLLMLKVLDDLKGKMFEDGRFFIEAILLPISIAAVAEAFRFDYGALGILSILVVYLASVNNLLELFAGAISFLWELPAPLGFAPILLYNGNRGIKLKYLFYIIYPLHLLIIAGIAYKMGIFSYITVSEEMLLK